MKKHIIGWDEYSNEQYPPESNAKKVILIQGEKDWRSGSLLNKISITLTNEPDDHNGRSDLFYIMHDSDLMFLFDGKSRKLENAKKYVIKRLKWLRKQLIKIDLDSCL